MFITAGYLTEQLTGKSWEQQLQGRDLRPLGMSRTNTSVTETEKTDDFSYPYTTSDEARWCGFRSASSTRRSGRLDQFERRGHAQVHPDADRLGHRERQAVLFARREHQDADPGDRRTPALPGRRPEKSARRPTLSVSR
jgi:CubicO group peptidase (beta-lactamase class C family)